MGKDHTLRVVRAMVDEVCSRCQRNSTACIRAKAGRRLRRRSYCGRQRLPILYSIRSERLMMVEIEYSLLFRRFVGCYGTMPHARTH